MIVTNKDGIKLYLDFLVFSYPTRRLGHEKKMPYDKDGKICVLCRNTSFLFSFFLTHFLHVYERKKDQILQRSLFWDAKKYKAH